MEAQQRLKRRRSSMSSSESISPLRKQGTHHSVSGSGALQLKMAADFAALEHDAVAMHQRLSKGIDKSGKKSQRRTKPFPIKLMTTLMENPNEDAVAWLPDGKSFVVVNPDIFVENVLKKTFKQCKYASFVRKLHRWGFVRLTSGTGTDCFHHPLFQENRMEMVQRIFCTPRETHNIKGGENPKQQQVIQQQQQLEAGPPSLQGVEKFFRARDETVSTTLDSNVVTTPSENHEDSRLA